MKDYSIDLDIKFKPNEIIDVAQLIENCTKDWQNLSLCKVNESVIRLAVIKGEFHWHQHQNEDEFFFVIEGKLLIDLKDQTMTLKANQGIMIPKGTTHRTRAPSRTAVLLMEKSTVNPLGD